METRKIKFFNRTMVYNNLDKLDYYIHDMKLAREYQKYNVENFGIIDRTGSMKHFFDVLPESYVPDKIENYNKTFYDITLKKSKQLIDTNKQIYLFWSGGIDSTVILSAFYEMDINSEQIIICMTHDSLYESGSLYDDVIKNKFHKYILIPPPLNKLWEKLPEDSIYVTGNHGNLISGIFKKYISPYQRKQKIESYYNDKFLYFYEPFIKKFPRKIETVEQFNNSLSFNFNWNGNTYFLYHAGIKNPSQTLVNFFSDLEYQNMFISSNEYDNQKIYMKKFIFKCLGSKSKEYIENKRTRFSYLKELNNNLFVLEDNTIIRNINEI